MKYKYLEHTADIKFQAFGNSIEEVYENSALAMFNAMSEDKIAKKIKKKISVKGNLKHSLAKEILKFAGGGEIRWNFEKFLFNQKREFVARFGSRTNPMDQDFISKIEQLLKQIILKKKAPFGAFFYIAIDLSST